MWRLRTPLAAGLLCLAVLVASSSAITVDLRRVNLEEILKEYQHTPAVPTTLVELSAEPDPETGEPQQPQCVPNVPNIRGVLPSSCCGDNKCPLHRGTCCAGDTHCCGAGSICLQGDPGTPPGCLNVIDYIPKKDLKKYLHRHNPFGVGAKEGPNGEDIPEKMPLPETEPSKKADGKLNYEDAFAPHARDAHSQLRVATTTNFHIDQIQKDLAKKDSGSDQPDATTVAESGSDALKPSAVAEQWDTDTRRAVGDLPAEDPKELLKRVEDQIKQYAGEGSEESTAPVATGDAPYLVMVPSHREHHKEVKSENDMPEPLQVILAGPTKPSPGPVEVRNDDVIIHPKAVLDYKFKQVHIDESLAPKRSAEEKLMSLDSGIPELERLGVPESAQL